jgi:hypothetical protein
VLRRKQTNLPIGVANSKAVPAPIKTAKANKIHCANSLTKLPPRFSADSLPLLAA